MNYEARIPKDKSGAKGKCVHQIHYYIASIMKVFFFIPLFIIHSAFAQTQYIFTRYSQDDGLASNKIQIITEDNRGFIWLASGEGLTRFDGYTFKTYMNEVSDPNSLPDNAVLAFNFDSRGNLLVKTESGLSRYDARNDHFVRLLSFTDTNRVLAQQPGIHDDVWACTSRNLLDVDAQTGRYHSYPLPKSFFKEPISEVRMKLQDGRLWIFYDRDILYFDLKKKKVFPVQINDEINQPLVQPLRNRKEILYSHGKTFLLCQQGLFMFSADDGNFHQLGESEIPGGENNVIQTIINQDDESVLISTSQNDLLKFFFADGREEKIILHSGDGKKISNLFGVVSATNDIDGTAWFTTDGYGIFHLDPEKNFVEQFTYNPNNVNSISSNAVVSIYRDRSGVFWLACRGQGLVKMEKIQQVFHPFSVSKKNSPASPSDDQNVRAVCELDHDHLLIGTLGGLFSFSKIDSTSTKIQLKQDVQAIGALFRDDERKIWIGSWGLGKVIVLDPRSNNMTSLMMSSGDSSTPCKIVRAITEDKNKNIWIGTVCGLFEVNESVIDATASDAILQAKKFQTTDTNFLRNAAVYSLLVDGKKRLWIGTSEGLNMLDEASGIIKKFINGKDDIQSLPMNNVRSLLEDHSGIIWVGTNGGGLSRFDEASGTFTTYTMKDGLPNEAIYAMQEDANGFLWLATNKGLCRFDTKNISCRNFKLPDGLQNLEFNTNASFKMPGGEMIFGGVRGFNYFNPKLISEKNLQQPVTITSVKVFDHNIPFDTSQITLAHNQNYLSFEFVAQSHYRTQDNQYSYMLEGEDKDWIFGGNRRYASYTNLAPGRYVFHVRISNSSIASDTEASIPIYILSPWYRTSIAIYLFVITAVALIFLIFQILRTNVIRRERASARIREAELRTQALEIKNQSAQRELEKAKELELAYNQLKAAQEQLVQQEKLASLGELTAGIAHEIKNPLNFVNNFSETSVEILDELHNATSDEERSKLSNELKQNLEKILKHSKRADSIVKNMLQHSRTGTGEKQPVDINSLCDEFLNLSYHGMRANYRDFQSNMEKNFSDDLPKVNVVTQDIGRVLLNLFNNAFYAVYERQKMENASQSFKAKTENPFQPTVRVSTELKNNSVIVKVRDNGQGVPDHIKQKIFEPFFTTKPSGIGTGLGLSLSYDIMKAHGGELKVESKVNEFTEFTIVIPA